MFGKDIEHPRTSMSKEIATRVACWLRSKTRVKTARPVTVQIGRRLYPAARYTEAHKGVLLQERLYIVGEMPPLQNRLKRACYRTDHSDDGWHLLTWFRLKRRCLEWEEAYPFGTHFVLVFQSALENWADEQAEGKRLHRIPMTISEIGPPAPDVNQPVKEKKDEPS
jgi:hypothetical protein